MSEKSDDYASKHRILLDKLKEGPGYCRVAELAREVKMDRRTVLAHFKVMEMDGLGVFLLLEDDSVFATKTGVAAIAERIGMKVESKNG